MKFDTPATANPIDRQRVIGHPHDRIDGPLKVTGTARYAYERQDAAPDAAYGWMVGSAIAKGRIRSIDTREAEAVAGVIAVVTAANAGPLKKADSHAAALLAGPAVSYTHLTLPTKRIV